MRAPDSDLWNEDLAPTVEAQRNWRWWHFAALWLGMVICVPAYMLASGLIEQGMSASQAVLTVLLGNVIVLVPMLLIGHSGARWGVPYAVLARASFGWKGARVPAVARAIVACGWYGIQTWIGGGALLTLLGVIVGRKLEGAPLPLLGIGVGQLLAFFAFWGVQLLFVTKGLTAIRRLETWTAPIKILICALMVWWAVDKAGGLGPILHQPSAFAAGGAKAGQFWSVFAPALTAMVGFWATLALNIPDFTRFARRQSDQIIGQAVGLPVPMGLLALVSVVTTSATTIIFGKAIWDPVQLAGDIGGIAVVVGLLIISLDTVCCNIAANLVGPAYDFSALWPSKISYRMGGWITAVIGVLIMPWKLLETTQGYIFTWLVGYGALLGPIAGILIVDYWIVRKARLDVDDLYVRDGAYAYRGGWNPAAVAALLLGVAPNIPGFLAAAAPHLFGGVGSIWTGLYTYAWFVGLAIAAIVYGALMYRFRTRDPAIP
ncbi:nitrate reductase [Caulobacter vibrioides]|uniref:NCS1 family nucleobase:cation symporter-1 n=1 Tax=Caulobacter vibrioides TaxID=155892 RepID=UPI000BB46729|nr:NCS1 family nucleobase:cation symporter-1 [Caulobacter vibrioides]ATC25350.1 nitrate reductase [Caulobacter vibrioides]AZH13440.1 nitrate reductase [Caulobacter vibrioides]PLR14116.1 nitrate reductase [Caulobacter vibrioides]